MMVRESEERIRAWAADRHIPDGCVERWLELSNFDGIALYDVARKLNLRTAQFMAMFEMLDEISVRDNRPISVILAAREIQHRLSGPGSAPARARLLAEQLRELRFPHLREELARIREQVASLGLPRAISVTPPNNLSSDELRIEITAHNGAELERLVGILRDKLTELKRISELLGGRDEV
ncbi:MAG: hypothetical protein ACREQ4_08350 [Candidatus Binataceae bacterium]